MKPVMPLDMAPAILSSMGRTDRVTASLRLPFFSWPYSMESVRERMAVIWMNVPGMPKSTSATNTKVMLRE